MLKYTEFINESTTKKKPNILYPLILSVRFINILKDSHLSKNNIAKRLLDCSRNLDLRYDISFIDVIDKNDTISYISTSKIRDIYPYIYNNSISLEDDVDVAKEVTIRYTSSLLKSHLRQNTKIGKFINKIFKGEFKEKEVEIFVNKFKGVMIDVFSNFEIVDGDKIKYWYNCDNYLSDDSGSLGSSCMGSGHKGDYLGMYIENPGSVKMLILKSGEDKKKIIGRALIWKLSHPVGVTFMDRIYTKDEYLEPLFKKYADDNKWWYKTKQGIGNYDIYCDVGIKSNVEMEVSIKKSHFEEYPYLDTFVYLLPYDNILKTTEPYDMTYYELNGQDGDYDEYYSDDDF